MVAFGAALLSLAQLGCQPITTGNRLTVASAGKISSLDPAQASTVNTIQLLSALGDPLYSLDGNGELIPRLAEASPIVSPDGLTVEGEGHVIVFHPNTGAADTTGQLSFRDLHIDILTAGQTLN